MTLIGRNNEIIENQSLKIGELEEEVKDLQRRLELTEEDLQRFIKYGNSRDKMLGVVGDLENRTRSWVKKMKEVLS